MKISTKGRYGLRALIDLALHSTGKPILLSQIAQRQSISKRYLERLFTQLRDGGIIRSVRGASGGYLLNRSADEILALEILEVLEGPLSPVDCILDDKLCPQTTKCVTHDLWVDLAGQIRNVLQTVSLEDLKQKQMQLEKDRALMFYI